MYQSQRRILVAAEHPERAFPRLRLGCEVPIHHGAQWPLIERAGYLYRVVVRFDLGSGPGRLPTRRRLEPVSRWGDRARTCEYGRFPGVRSHGLQNRDDADQGGDAPVSGTVHRHRIVIGLDGFPTLVSCAIMRQEWTEVGSLR